MPRIVSVSRRTDIPAFYADWFMNRVRAGFACVRNPFNAKQVKTVSLAPSQVACLVFWTRDPRPLLPHLDELDGRGLRYYFHVTLTGLPRHWEPASPPSAGIVAALHALARRIGPARSLWRFDPLLLARHRGGERMVHERPLPRLLVALEEREVDHPVEDLGRRVGWEVESGLYHATAAALNALTGPAEPAGTPDTPDGASTTGGVAGPPPSGGVHGDGARATVRAERTAPQAGGGE